MRKESCGAELSIGGLADVSGDDPYKISYYITDETLALISEFKPDNVQAIMDTGASGCFARFNNKHVVSKRGPSAFILAYLIETELNLPLREDLTCFL